MLEGGVLRLAALAQDGYPHRIASWKVGRWSRLVAARIEGQQGETKPGSLTAFGVTGVGRARFCNLGSVLRYNRIESGIERKAARKRTGLKTGHYKEDTAQRTEFDSDLWHRL